MRVECASNLKQCHLILQYYAYDYRDHLPPASDRQDVVGSAFYVPGNGYDLRNYIGPYIGDYRIWRCPALSEATPLDDPGNTRHVNYSTYAYWPGRSYPDFGTTQAVPTWTMGVDTTSQRVVMQDLYDESAAKPGWERFNHGNGEAVAAPTNPSFRLLRDDEPGEGANLSFFDGHVKWFSRPNLVPVGLSLKGLSLTTYSVMP